MRSKQARAEVLASIRGQDDPPPPPVPGEVVYFVQHGCCGPIKIGKTRDIEKRMSTMEADAPEPLKLVLMLSDATEAQMHKRFAGLRGRGEWFKPAPQLVEFVNSFADRSDPMVVAVRLNYDAHTPYDGHRHRTCF